MPLRSLPFGYTHDSRCITTSVVGAINPLSIAIPFVKIWLVNEKQNQILKKKSGNLMKLLNHYHFQLDIRLCFFNFGRVLSPVLWADDSQARGQWSGITEILKISITCVVRWVSAYKNWTRGNQGGLEWNNQCNVGTNGALDVTTNQCNDRPKMTRDFCPSLREY